MDNPGSEYYIRVSLGSPQDMTVSSGAHGTRFDAACGMEALREHTTGCGFVSEPSGPIRDTHIVVDKKVAARSNEWPYNYDLMNLPAIVVLLILFRNTNRW